MSQGVVVKCHVEAACVGGQDSLCGDGHSGRRCGQCSDGYFKMARLCKQCSSGETTIALFVLLVLAGLLLIAFFEWQTIRDPRIGSPLVLIMRLLETLGIFALCVARWPRSIPVFLSFTSLVNLNTEVFQTECLLGRSHPTREALTYFAGIPVLLLVLLLFYPLLQLGKYCVRYDREASLESMCEPLRPGRDGSALGFGLPFTPVKALMAANFKEYTKIALTVSVSIP